MDTLRKTGRIAGPIGLAVLALASGPAHAQWNYPATKTVDASDTYFGKTYKDPYRWLENLKDKDVEAWFKAQATLTDGALDKIPGKDALAQEWMALDKLQPAKYSDITFENGRVFYKKTLGGENVGRLFYRQGWDGAEKLLFDPGPYKAGVTTTIQSFVPSFDGRHVAMPDRCPHRSAALRHRDRVLGVGRAPSGRVRLDRGRFRLSKSVSAATLGHRPAESAGASRRRR